MEPHGTPFFEQKDLLAAHLLQQHLEMRVPNSSPLQPITKAQLSTCLVGRFVEIVRESEKQESLVSPVRGEDEVSNRHKSVVTRVEFFGLTLRAVASIALQLIKSAAFCVALGVTLGQVKKGWLESRIAAEFALVGIAVEVVKRAAVGIFKPEKACDKAADFGYAHLERMRNNVLFTEELVSEEASEHREAAWKESAAQMSLTHIAAYHQLDRAKHKKFDTAFSYFTNLVYSVAVLAWNTLCLAIYGIAYAATGMNKSLKARLEVTKESIIDPTWQAVVESAKGVVYPTRTANRRLDKLLDKGDWDSSSANADRGLGRVVNHIHMSINPPDFTSSQFDGYGYDDEEEEESGGPSAWISATGPRLHTAAYPPPPPPAPYSGQPGAYPPPLPAAAYGGQPSGFPPHSSSDAMSATAWRQDPPQ